MELKLLFIEDDENLGKNLKEIFDGETILEYQIQADTVSVFEEGINSIKSKDYDIEKLPIIDIKTFAGVSAGSIFGLMFLMGYTPKEMEDEIINKKLDQLKDIRFFNFATKYGIDSGNNIIKWIESLMTRKEYDKNITFDSFFEKKLAK